jgi:uncharacterized protein YdaU (DUF1376 family)
LKFYKRDITAWMDGTEALSDGAYRAYDVIVNLIYLHEGPITLNEKGIAGRCNQSTRAFRCHLRELFDSGKLRLDSGKLVNVRAEKEIEILRKPTKSPERSDKPLENNTARNNGAKPISLDKTREDKNRQEKISADALDDPRAVLFDEGITLLVALGLKEARARPMIGRWLRDASDDAVRVMDAIRRAKSQSVAEPISWISANLNPKVVPYGPASKDTRNDYQRRLEALKQRSRGDNDTEPVSETWRGPIIEGDFTTSGAMAEPKAK